MSIYSASELELSLISLMDQIPLQLDRGDIKEREDGNGWGGAFAPGRRFFLIFPSKGGDYLREVINQGTAIEGWLLFEEIHHIVKH